MTVTGYAATAITFYFDPARSWKYIYLDVGTTVFNCTGWVLKRRQPDQMLRTTAQTNEGGAFTHSKEKPNTSTLSTPRASHSYNLLS